MIEFLTTDVYGYPLWLCLFLVGGLLAYDPFRRRDKHNEYRRDCEWFEEEWFDPD